MYKTRFIKQDDAFSLINLYHLAKTAGMTSRWERMVWASKEFIKTHPNVSETGAYKDLDGLLS